ncbi:MAG: N-acetyltransferase [Calditrichaeota bacterium]|nr:MAG: N-acetyltransferase [Calditrichota bacterium]
MKKQFIHQTALVETESIGEGTSIWAFAHVMKHARIGSNCNVGDHCFIESGAEIGNNVTIKNGCMIWEGITVEDGVFIGPNVLFTNDRYPRSPRLPEAEKRYSTKNWLLPTRIKRGVSIGAGAVLMPGITIGKYATVAAGAVVVKDVPAFGLVVGNPARQRGWVCKCGQVLTFKNKIGECQNCKSTFKMENNLTVQLIG